MGAKRSAMVLRPCRGKSSTIQAFPRSRSVQSSCNRKNIAPGGNPPSPGCVGISWRRPFADGTMRQRLSRLEIDRDARQVGVGVRRGVKQVALGEEKPG